MDRGQDIHFVYEDGVLKPEGPLDLPEGTRGVARIRPDEPGDRSFWTHLSAEEHRKRQNPLPVTRPEDLMGDWPEDESVDEFIKNIHERGA
jgi:predicted DNA-binding antitoxin AbrB/MazE fold protein